MDGLSQQGFDTPDKLFANLREHLDENSEAIIPMCGVLNIRNEAGEIATYREVGLVLKRSDGGARVLHFRDAETAINSGILARLGVRVRFALGDEWE